MSFNFTQIEFNEQFERAFNLIEYSNKNVFITGKAGTGKSTLLKYFKEHTKKNVVFLSPTGVSAINIQGQTIHSFFNFKPDITPDKAEKLKPVDGSLYKDLDTIVIDEVSMVRADLLDCIDRFLRKNGPQKKKPFGGVQMILIGDLYQLPPVVTTRDKDIFSNLYKSPYFFDAHVFKVSKINRELNFFQDDSSDFKIEFVELEKVYRQRDKKFVEILNSIRNNTVTDEQLQILNSRYSPDIEDLDGYIYLTSTNDLADKINQEKLDSIDCQEFVYQGKIKGEFGLTDLPTSLELKIKIGAQVMLLNNDSSGRWINGTIGVVQDIITDVEDHDIIIVKLANGEAVEVEPFQWQMFKFHYDVKEKKIFTQSVGTYTQYPLKLAWAITIHKSQGLTFDKVIIDIGKGTFAHGQMYVALSRCTSLKGLVLKRPIMKKQILMDRRIIQFVTQFQYRDSEKKCPLEEKIEILKSAMLREKPLEIVYLKTIDEKSRRVILPIEVGEMSYRGKRFLGVRGICNLRGEERTFVISRILEIKEVE